MKQTYVGTFRCGHTNVDLYALPEESGGYFYGCPDEKSCARIKVGLRHGCWDQVIAVLMHETLELVFSDMRLRFEHAAALASDHAAYLFVMDHCQFTEAVASAAMFITEAVPKLAKLWQRRHRRKRK